MCILRAYECVQACLHVCVCLVHHDSAVSVFECEGVNVYARVSKHVLGEFEYM